MSAYRKKPVVIEAIQWMGDNRTKVFALAPNEGMQVVNGDILIPTREGTMRASPRDWIIRGVAGEIYPCKPDIFTATYEEA